MAPFRVFGIAARPLASPPPAVLFWNWLLVQSFPPRQVSPAWVGRFHFAVGRFLGCVAFPESSPPVTVKRPTDPLFEFHLPLESCPTKPSRTDRSQTAPLMDFRSLQHMQEPEIHLARALPARLVAPSGFGYPLDALLSLVPGRFYFTPAALMGFTLRSFPLSKRHPSRFQPRPTHLPFQSASTPVAEATNRPCRPATPGF